MRTLWNRAATCTSTTFHRSDAHHQSSKCTLIAQLKTYHTFLLLQFSAAASFRILIQKSITTYKSIFRFQNLEEFFRHKSLNLVNCPFQVPTATSQHMDDLFDILIESGGKEVHKHSTEPERCIYCEQVVSKKIVVSGGRWGNSCVDISVFSWLTLCRLFGRSDWYQPFRYLCCLIMTDVAPQPKQHIDQWMLDLNDI